MPDVNFCWQTILATVKIWATVDSRLKKDLRALTADLGFKSETECVREALRQGVQVLEAQRSIFGSLAKQKNSILQSAGLLEKEYEQLRSGELEARIRSQWTKVKESA